MRRASNHVASWRSTARLTKWLHRTSFASVSSVPQRTFNSRGIGSPRLNGVAIAREKSARRYRDWPGARQVFGATFVADDRFIRPLDDDRLNLAFHRAAPSERFDELLDLFDSRIQGLFGDTHPDCIIVCLPDELADLRISNPKLSAKECEILERLQREEEQEQMSLFQPTPEEMKAAEELRTTAEDSLFRTFYRALKARTMTHQNPVPIQVIRRETFLRPDEEGQSFATRAWNLATSLFYKAGHEPWRPGDLLGNTCFIGISFHHLKRREGDVVYASVAQAFSNDVEPFALKGSLVPHNQRRDRQPYLTESQFDGGRPRQVQGSRRNASRASGGAQDEHLSARRRSGVPVCRRIEGIGMRVDVDAKYGVPANPQGNARALARNLVQRGRGVISVH